jgi:hypothetical protein
MSDAAEVFNDEDYESTPESRGDVFIPEDQKAKSAEKAEEVLEADIEVAKGEQPDSEDEVPSADVENTAEAEEEPEQTKVRGIRVPKFRLDAVTARAKAAEQRAQELEARLAALEEQSKAPQATQQQAPQKSAAETHAELMDSYDERIAEAIAEGNSKEASKLMRESRMAQESYFNEQMTSRFQETTQQATRQATSQAQEAARMEAILDQLEEQFPVFAEGSEEYNQEVNDKVLEVQQAYIKAGRAPSDALVEAVNLVLPSFGYGSDVDEVAAKPSKAVTKRETNVKQNVEAAKKQPPDVSSVGDDSDTAGIKGQTFDPTQLTEEEFDALPESKKRELRGDFV